ncbi:hypothetical protein [Legionella spiritensis]|nr:hypothetical protein [Legionella spiritensis]
MMSVGARMRFFFFFLLIIPVVHADTPGPSGNYWQCITEDSTNKRWVAQSVYQLTAINKAFDHCKKNSAYPNTCKASKANCEYFILGRTTRPMWQCTALDFHANPWNSNLYRTMDDAALAAKAYCLDNSSVPATCYINMITCKNLNKPD